MAVRPNDEDWDKANNLKHLDLLEAPQLRAAYRELSALNYAYMRFFREIGKIVIDIEK